MQQQEYNACMPIIMNFCHTTIYESVSEMKTPQYSEACNVISKVSRIQRYCKNLIPTCTCHKNFV